MEKGKSQPSMDDLLGSIRQVIDRDDARSNAAGAVQQRAHSATETPRPRRGIAERLGAVHAQDRYQALSNDNAGLGSNDDGLLSANLLSEIGTEMHAPAHAMVPGTDDTVPGLSPKLVGHLDDGPHCILSQLMLRATTGKENTLEGLIADILRPMLQEWVDREAPALVEQLVSSEIRRISF